MYGLTTAQNRNEGGRKMKKVLFLIILTLVLTPSIFAQKEIPPPPESKSDLELTCDEATARINLYQQKVDKLAKDLQALKNEIMQMEQELATAHNSLDGCNKEILALCNATENDMEKYRQALGVLHGKVRAMQNLSNDVLADRRADVVALDEELNVLRANKLSVIPEFYDKILAIARDIDGLYREKKITGYTVGTWAQDKDCLWNISGKSDIYGDPFQWPKIWQANTNIIRNPDIIHPGQVLQVPPAGPKTDDEAKAERKYWRNKRAAAEAATTPAP